MRHLRYTVPMNHLLIPVIILLLLIAALLLAVLFLLLAMRRQGPALQRELPPLLDDVGDDITDRISGRIGDIRRDIADRLKQDAEENRQNRREVSDMLAHNTDTQLRRIEHYQEKLESTLKTALTDLQETNRRKLSDMQTDINQKLDSALNERLDKSFQNVSEQLNQLYESLGKLKELENGVLSLNHTLANVKTRGIFGETQLENILSDILSGTLYDKNVVTKQSAASRDAVEFAVKIPDKETPGAFMYLPIDSKFPASIYDRIRTAAENADPEGLQKAVKELEQFIKAEARSIHDKYLDPPHTTDFALMFLPTESLFAEVLRIPGLSEELQRTQHVVITGPTTIAALLNALNIGFRYMAVNRDSQNILKLLSAIKAQYGMLAKLIGTADSRIDLAKKATTELRHRTDIINKKLSSVEELDASEAKKLLGMPASDDMEGE